MTRAIRGLGRVAGPFIPRRIEDRYDLTDAAVAALCAEGIDVIVTDHHVPGGSLPDCLAVLNPKRPGCEYPDDDLAAVGVAFKLALALARELGASENVVYHQLDL